MKKMIFILVVTLSLFVVFGCSNNVPNVSTSTEEVTMPTTELTEPTSESEEKNIVDAFIAMGASESIDLIRMSDFLEANISRLSPENADQMLQTYESAQMDVLPTYQDAFLNDPIQSILLTYSIEDLRQNLVQEVEISDLLKEAASIGYKIEAVEGTVAPYVDYGYFARFNPYSTKSTGAFYTLMKTESDNPSQKDAALLISWEEVLQRGMNFESFLQNYPGSFYAERANMHLEGYSYISINGTANVPLFDYDTNIMNAEAKAAYLTFVGKEQKTTFAEGVKTFVLLLEKHQFIKTAEIEAFISHQ